MANRVLKATDLTIDGNLVVTGTTASVESTNSTLKDNIIVLNQGETGAGVTLVNAGLEIDRGTADNAQLVWDEVTDKWQLKVGTTITDTLSGSWIGLADTPGTFTADKFVKVNAGATALEFIDDPGLPAQATHAGKFLTTDGTDASWVDESTINTSHTTAAAAAKKALIYAIIFGG